MIIYKFFSLQTNDDKLLLLTRKEMASRSTINYTIFYSTYSLPSNIHIWKKRTHSLKHFRIKQNFRISTFKWNEIRKKTGIFLKHNQDQTSQSKESIFERTNIFWEKKNTWCIFLQICSIKKSLARFFSLYVCMFDS